MRKLILSAIYMFITLLTFAQTNPVKVADFFADFEIKPYNGNVMDTVYNTGVDVVLPVFVRFKLKGAYGSGIFSMVPQKSYASILYEHANGFDFNPLPNGIDLSRNEWIPSIGSIYSPYVKVDLTLHKEYLKSGKLKTYYMSEYDAVNRGWQNRLQASFTRNITVIDVANFIGPDAICNEGTFTIERPGTITLENATGIATLTALGNNQWKITKTNSLGGVVVLKSQSGTKSFTKSIKIDPSYLDGIINGPVMIKQTDADLNFVFEPSNNEVDFTDLIWSTNNPYVKLNKVNETTATLTFLPGFNIPSGQTNLNLEITASKSNSCGVISISTIVKVRK
ncbi:hypothetical protein [uncultured Sphingobacterium sp.]|uniref:hypothetical protein n=1 Tax=uncultured Sphingobacterium sp. TaxID=182688 RepID=UPI003749C170